MCAALSPVVAAAAAVLLLLRAPPPLRALPIAATIIIISWRWRWRSRCAGAIARQQPKLTQLRLILELRHRACSRTQKPSATQSRRIGRARGKTQPSSTQHRIFDDGIAADAASAASASGAVLLPSVSARSSRAPSADQLVAIGGAVGRPPRASSDDEPSAVARLPPMMSLLPPSPRAAAAAFCCGGGGEKSGGGGSGGRGAGGRGGGGGSVEIFAAGGGGGGFAPAATGVLSELSERPMPVERWRRSAIFFIICSCAGSGGGAAGAAAEVVGGGGALELDACCCCVPTFSELKYFSSSSQTAELCALLERQIGVRRLQAVPRDESGRTPLLERGLQLAALHL